MVPCHTPSGQTVAPPASGVSLDRTHHQHRCGQRGDRIQVLEPGARTDPLSGRRVVIVGDRQDRPNLLDRACPFCPGGLEAPEPYQVRWFPNRWPPLPDGRAEVVLFSPDHHAGLSGLDAAALTRVVECLTSRTTALAHRADVEYVLIFENRGAEVGATIDHPHGQIYALAEVPDEALRELNQPSCALCQDHLAPGAPAPDLSVSQVGSWKAQVPEAAAWPFEMLLAPVEHIPDLPSQDGDNRGDLARLLGDVLGRLDRLFDAPMPYMMWLHQRPFDGRDWPQAHLHIHVAPVWRGFGLVRFVAAGELGSGIMFNPVPPPHAALQLRRANEDG